MKSQNSDISNTGDFKGSEFSRGKNAGISIGIFGKMLEITIGYTFENGYTIDISG